MSSIRDVIRQVLESSAGQANEDLAREVVSRIPEDEIPAALEEALAAVIPQVRNAQNRALLREPAQETGIPVKTAATFTGPSGATYASPRTGMIAEDIFLQYAITGAGARSIKLANAGIQDLRFEIDVSRSKGETLIGRADLFEEVLREMAVMQVRKVSDLPAASRAKYARRLKELYDRD